MNSMQPFKINWIDLVEVGYPGECLGIGTCLPGCKHRFIQRDLQRDIAVIKSSGVTDVILLCENKELDRFGVPDLIQQICNPALVRNEDNIDEPGNGNMEEEDFVNNLSLHHYPCEYGLFPSISALMDIFEIIFKVLQQGGKMLIICRDGLGRSSVVIGTLLLHTNENLLHDDVYDSLKRILGTRAVQTVKQYNMLVDFRQLRDEEINKQSNNHSENNSSDETDDCKDGDKDAENSGINCNPRRGRCVSR